MARWRPLAAFLVVVGIVLSSLSAAAATVSVLAASIVTVESTATTQIEMASLVRPEERSVPEYTYDNASNRYADASNTRAIQGAAAVHAYDGANELSGRSDLRVDGVIYDAPAATAAAEGGGGAASTLPQYLYHYTSEETAALVEGSQLGLEGRTLYLTPKGTLQPLQAGIELALPQTNTASAVFRVPSSALVPVNILRIGPVTGNLLGRGGGGIEILYDGSIPIEFVTRVQ